MRAYIAVTDRDWFDHLRRLQPAPGEVNFWKPGEKAGFQALSLGQPLIFKLRYPENAIVGAGFFTHFTQIPLSIAWASFEERNGTTSLQRLRQMIEGHRRIAPSTEDYRIGCILLAEPFFLDEQDWIPAPSDFSPNIVSGKNYSLADEPGRSLWAALLARRRAPRTLAAEPPAPSLYGDPALYRPRLGQGAFRLIVTDNYDRRCAVTGEHTLPVLEAAHIKPVARGGTHDLQNGLLLRSDIHTLFDEGYVTVTKDRRFRVSDRLKKDWQNGRVYYALHGQQIHTPSTPDYAPHPELLEWHADTIFLG